MSTAPTLKLLNHHPLLEDLLHEAFLKKDYLGQAPFLPAGPGPLLPAGALQPAPGPPAPESPPRTPALPRAAFPTDPLTTPAGRPGPWGEAWGAVPGADPSWSSTAVPESSPASPSWAPATPGTSLGPRAGAGVVPRDEEGTTTTSTITTTTVTTLQGPGGRWGGSWGGGGELGQSGAQPGSPLSPAPCNRTLAGPEGWLVSPEPAAVPYDGSLDCTYTISVYPGYGVELKVSWGPWVGWGAKRPQASVVLPCHSWVAVWGAANARSCPCPCPHVPEPGELAQDITRPRAPGRECGRTSRWDAPGCPVPTGCRGWHPSQKQRCGI